MPEVMVAFLAASCSFCLADLILRTPEAGPFLDDEELLCAVDVPPKAAMRAASLGAVKGRPRPAVWCEANSKQTRGLGQRAGSVAFVQLVGRDFSFSRAAFSLAASGLSNAFCRARARCSARLRSSSFSRCVAAAHRGKKKSVRAHHNKRA